MINVVLSILAIINLAIAYQTGNCFSAFAAGYSAAVLFGELLRRINL